MKEVLVFAAHPDDELLGLGGTVRRFSNEGMTVRAVIMAEGITSREEKRTEVTLPELDELQVNARKAAKIVGYTSIDFCGFPDNRMDGMELLDVIKTVSKFVEKYQPDTIFTHHHGDLNIDHRITCEAVLTACRPVFGENVKSIYAFETPSSSEWDYNYRKAFNPNFFVDISSTFEDKINGMKNYISECREFPHPRSEKALRALAFTRGSQVGVEKAEAFMVLRELI